MYAVWKRDSGDFDHGTHIQTMFTRTTDGGRTWEPARAISVAGNDDTLTAHQVLVQPDGTLVIIAQQDVRRGTSTDSFLSTFRSTDRGATWSAPMRGPQMFFNFGIDPDTGQGIGDGNPDFAVDPNTGNLYAVWNDTRFLGGQYDSVAFTMSTNAKGKTHRPARVVWRGGEFRPPGKLLTAVASPGQSCCGWYGALAMQHSSAN